LDSYFPHRMAVFPREFGTNPKFACILGHNCKVRVQKNRKQIEPNSNIDSIRWPYVSCLWIYIFLHRVRAYLLTNAHTGTPSKLDTYTSKLRDLQIKFSLSFSPHMRKLSHSHHAFPTPRPRNFSIFDSLAIVSRLKNCVEYKLLNGQTICKFHEKNR